MKKIFLLALLFVSTATFAMVQDEVPDVDLTNITTIIGILTPLLTLASTWVAKKLIPALSGVGTLIIVPVLAGLITLITNAVVNTDLSWIVQLLLGTGAVFLNQLYRQFAGSGT